jgi:hypothetical protein
MSSTAPVLEVIYRVEPGCLGPQGKDYIEDFCTFSQPLVTAHTAGFMRWILVPRFDKSLPEMQCTLAGRTLTAEQAKRYFALFQVDADDLEAELNEQLTLLIDQYFGRW